MDKKLLTKAFYNGVREGIEQYAHWKDGVQYVGSCGTTLKDALKRIDSEEARALEMLKELRETKSKLGYSRIGLRNV